MSSLQWDNKIGLASILGAAQLAVLAVGGVVFVWRMQDGIDAVKAQQASQAAIVHELKAQAERDGNRVTAVETTIGYVKDTLVRIERKVEAAHP
jgi:hypothetical protein